jgi:hypothetical protein
MADARSAADLIAPGHLCKVSAVSVGALPSAAAVVNIPYAIADRIHVR